MGRWVGDGEYEMTVNRVHISNVIVKDPDRWIWELQNSMQRMVITPGQLTWQKMSRREKQARVRIEIEAARVAADVDTYADMPNDDEYGGIHMGWEIHKMTADQLKAEITDWLTESRSPKRLIGWLAREIYIARTGGK